MEITMQILPKVLQRPIRNRPHRLNRLQEEI
jgi:hypothetical protein